MLLVRSRNSQHRSGRTILRLPEVISFALSSLSIDSCAALDAALQPMNPSPHSGIGVAETGNSALSPSNRSSNGRAPPPTACRSVASTCAKLIPERAAPSACVSTIPAAR